MDAFDNIGMLKSFSVPDLIMLEVRGELQKARS
jgi:hypothetical protein